MIEDRYYIHLNLCPIGMISVFFPVTPFILVIVVTPFSSGTRRLPNIQLATLYALNTEYKVMNEWTLIQ
jgi:hypothetical protein